MGTESKLWPLRKRVPSQHPQRETQLAQTLSSPWPFLQSAWKHRTRNSAPPAPPSKSKTKRCEMERWLRKPPGRIWGLLCPGPPHLARRLVQHRGFRHKQLRTPRCPRRGKPGTAAPSRVAGSPARISPAPPLVHVSLGYCPPYGLQRHCLPGRAVHAPPAVSDLWRRCRLRDAAPADGAPPNLATLGCSFRGPQGEPRARRITRGACMRGVAHGAPRPYLCAPSRL